MNSNTDHPSHIVADFLAWLRQNDVDGTGWFLDEGPVAMPEVPVPVPAPEPAAQAQAPQAAPETDDPFAAECARFVADTLENIRRQPANPEAASPAADPSAELDALRKKVEPCTACELHAGRTRTVFGSGSPRAKILFIGEAPGRDEDLQGEPFVGRSGQLLTKIIASIGFDRQEVFICNILKCRPPENRDPLPAEVACCEPFLQAQLAIIQPRVICCLGRVAAQTLLKTDASLRALRETAHFYQGIPVMATYHPAALLRNPGWKRDTWNDVRKLRALHDALNGDAGEGA
jgi:uracil-DNA glycosylase family 4